MKPPKAYDDWLALTAEQQHHIHHHVWNTYSGDGLAFALIAASRLALTSPLKIRHISTGIYHGGEHVLHLKVAPSDYVNCPPMLEQEFEGFRVIWMEDRFCFDCTGDIPGSWKAIDDSTKPEFVFQREQEHMKIHGRSPTGESLSISEQHHSEQYVRFTAIGPTADKETQYGFGLIAPDRCSASETTTTYWQRASKTQQDTAVNP